MDGLIIQICQKSISFNLADGLLLVIVVMTEKQFANLHSTTRIP